MATARRVEGLHGIATDRTRPALLGPVAALAMPGHYRYHKREGCAAHAAG